jgi:high-affinity K+ transport system ATPase subunit B
LFANFAEAVAEGHGKAQADALRKARKDTVARRLRNGREERVPAPELQKGDTVVCEAGDIILADGEVIEGIATVDEAAITGESAPVIRERGGHRSAVTGGTRVISDRIVIRVTLEKGHGFLDRMIAMVEGAKRQKTPNEIALTNDPAVGANADFPAGVRDAKAVRHSQGCGRYHPRARRGQLEDVVKGGVKERFAHLRKMGIRTVMITGDNPLTAAAMTRPQPCGSARQPCRFLCLRFGICNRTGSTVSMRRMVSLNS